MRYAITAKGKEKNKMYKRFLGPWAIKEEVWRTLSYLARIYPHSATFEQIWKVQSLLFITRKRLTGTLSKLVREKLITQERE